MSVLPTQAKEQRSTEHVHNPDVQYLHILLTAKDLRQQQEYTRGTVLASQVYAVYFKANRQLIREYENLRNYTAEIYQMPGVLKLCG